MSFGSVAGQYNRLRPSAPPAAIDWLLPDPASGSTPDGLLQAIAGGQAASLPGLLASFIDCRWPLEYLPAGPPPV